MNDHTKKLLLQMAKVCEEFYYQSCVYQAVLQAHGRSGWREHAKNVLQDSKPRARVHELFQPVYTKIQAAEGLESEIETLLRDLLRADFQTKRLHFVAPMKSPPLGGYGGTKSGISFLSRLWDTREWQTFKIGFLNNLAKSLSR